MPAGRASSGSDRQHPRHQLQGLPVVLGDELLDEVVTICGWVDKYRDHAGIVFISTKTYPQDRTRVGRVTAALQKRLVDDAWPEPGHVDFL